MMYETSIQFASLALSRTVVVIEVMYTVADMWMLKVWIGLKGVSIEVKQSLFKCVFQANSCQ